MVVHTFHLAKPGLATTVAALVRPPTAATVAGLHHAEYPSRPHQGLRGTRLVGEP